MLDMSTPRSVKEVQKLMGCLADLGRFLSKAGDKCQYFFDAIKKKKKFEWTEEAKATFVRLKGISSFLTSPSEPYCP